MYFWGLFVVVLLASSIGAQKDPHFVAGRSTIVHLFEWKWQDVANECETWLKDKGFGGVQVSPPSENLVIYNGNERPWWERYQPVSYALNTRSGNRDEFANMVKRCNSAGIRIYVDAVINHMTGMGGNGTAGNKADHTAKHYPGVPFSANDFHATCSITNYNDPTSVRNCELVGLRDLNQGSEYVRQKIVDYLNHLIVLGVAGFRVDAAKHMWPDDLELIYSRLHDLNGEHGFAKGARAFIFQEVIDMGGEAVSKNEYTRFGTVIEFKYSWEISNAFRGRNPLKYLANWGPQWGLLDGLDALAFVCNHDNQRSGDNTILTYKQSKPYKMAVAFMLAHPYGTTRIMSSFAFDTKDQGPPEDAHHNIVSPEFNTDNTCSNGWVCEHRWRQIYNMVKFRNAVSGTDIQNWWTNGDNQIAFSRGNKGFVAFTLAGDINTTIKTSLPGGIYCDIISGDLINGKCTGNILNIDSNGSVFVSLSQDEFDGVIAVHVDSKL